MLILQSMLTPVQPYDVGVFSQAIVDEGLGTELTWYTPTVTVMNISGAFPGWKAASDCRRGAIALNPLYANENITPMAILHELVHLHRNCSGSEQATTMAAFEAMSSLGRDEDVIAYLYRQVVTLEYGSDLPASMVKEYYRDPVNTILYYDVSAYPHLQETLERIGLREKVYGDKQ
jgi:hypothetical protein